MEKLHGQELKSPSKFRSPKITRKWAILLTAISTLFIIIIVAVYHNPAAAVAFSLWSSSDPIVPAATANKECDIFSGEWVHNPEAPYYTNKTCWAIHEHQNCIKYGRPDTDYMKWKWQPDGCNLPVFDPVEFLETMRDKSLAFVGDSVGRNQMQSLICLLSRVEYPIDALYTKDFNFQRFKYVTYNFTLATFWTPYLVRSNEADPVGPTNNGLFNLYLDEFDETWVNKVEDFHYIVLSSGHWFFRPLVFFEGKKVVGCYSCLQSNVADLGVDYGYRKVFRTALKAINNMKNFKGTTILRTFAPSHFEGGKWNDGGNCVRTRPFFRNQTKLETEHLEMYMSQIDEFTKARQEGKRKGLKFRLLDTTLASLLRPDGHPSTYGHGKHEKVKLYNDCVHWCLPGPIDTWNDFLLEMVKSESKANKL